MNIKNIEKYVELVLMTNIETRSDDFLLIYEVAKHFNYEVEFLSFEEVMKRHKELGIPSLQSITRTRRKIFEKYPYLKPIKITKKRNELQKDYKVYALSN